MSPAGRDVLRSDKTLCWTHWPLRDRWPGSALVPLSILSVVAAVHVSFQSLLFDTLAFVALLASLLKYLLPTRITLWEGGVRVKFALRARSYAWGEFAGCRRVQDGLMLSARRRGRGGAEEAFLPVPPERDDVRRYVEGKLAQ